MKKTIPGYEGHYEITENGKIWSFKSNRFLKPYLNSRGYYCQCLSLNGASTLRPTHQWVFISYVGSLKKGFQINHIDGVKTNNHYTNLEMVTPKENTQHAWSNGLVPIRYGSETPWAKLKETDIPKIRALYKQGFKQKEIAKQFAVNRTTITKILTNKSWVHA